MAKSKRNPNRKENLQNYKLKHKKNMPTQGQFEAPEVRQQPVWKPTDMIEVRGDEWEEIYNFLNSVTPAFMAANQVMSRNIVSGKVQLRFEKLNKANMRYEPMSPEEEKPYQEELQVAIKAAIEAQAKEQAPQVDSQEGVPFIDEIVKADGSPATQESKIVGMDGKPIESESL